MDRERDEPGARVVLARRLLLCGGEDGAELPRHQRRDERGEVAEAPVDRDAADVRLARDVGHRRAADPDRHDGLERRVEDRVLVDRAARRAHRGSLPVRASRCS